MIKFFKKILQRKPKSILLDNTYRIVPAFEWKGETYYMHEDPLNTATGRGLTAMVFLEELLMRCDIDFLNWHNQAVDKIFSDPKKIDIPMFLKLHNNMKERVKFLAALPTHVYRLASIVFFTKNESPFKYDKTFNEKKIKAWQETEGMYDFFLQSPLKTLVPYLDLPENNSREYLEVLEKVSNLHTKQLHDFLYSRV